ncbi:acyltransferase family protein [Rubrivivax sp. RP6-9]|uniref:acyltransferase family protein n=1 Tax=Rubrivivax sp. RP6-9 TaxID=3415750 RepID=UPI003CC62793
MQERRLTELDWVRIGAFGLLILYHVGMFYVPWDWHVKSPQPVPALESWMLLSAPWRLPLLFVVSGAATALLLQRGGPGAGLSGRSRRLLPPLLFGMAVVVPPQAYLEVVEKLGYDGSYADFLVRYFQADGSFCRGGDCLVLPTWNHLWFVAYLWVYTALLLAALRLGGGRWARSAAWQRLSGGARLLWVPCLVLGLSRQLVPHFPSTHDVVGDWFNHALYVPLFVLGCVLFGQRDDRHGAWAAAERLRWWALAAAVVSLLGMPRLLAALGGWDALPAWAQPAWLALGGLRHWTPVLAVLGFARRHLRERDGPALHTLREAVFPFYIVHQTIIVVAAHHLAQRHWPQALEAAVLVAVTAAGCWATYLAARRIGWLRPWLGLGPARGAGTNDNGLASPPGR